MGNLRQSMTDSEWNEIENQIKRDRELGKPEHGYIAVWVDELTIDQLKKLKKKLKKCNIPRHQYWRIDDWIKYQENKERESNKPND
jgi:hypothetical protein